MSPKASAWLFAVLLASAGSLSAQKSALLSRLEARGTAAVFEARFSPEGTALFFTADLLSDNNAQLFAARVGGAVRPEVVSSGGIGGTFTFSPDGRWVAYQSGDLFVRAVAQRGEGRRLAAGASSFSVPFAFTPDSTRIVYRDAGLRSALLDGSAPPLLLSPGSPESVLVTPDSTRAVYYAGGFHSVLLDGSSAPVQLTPPLTTSGAETEISPDSRWLLYAQPGTSVAMPTAWFSVPVDGSSAPVQITLPLDPAQRLISFHTVVPGASRLVYTVVNYVLFPQGPVFSAPELRSAPLDGSPGSLLVAAPSNILEGMLTGAGGWLVYRAFAGAGSTAQLFRLQADGSGPPKLLNAPLVPGGAVHAFALTPDGARVLFVADQDVPERRELYLAPLDGGAAPVRLSAPNPTGTLFQLPPLVSAGGRNAVYAVDERSTGEMSLWSVPLDKSGAARELVRIPGLGLSFTSPVITMDGRRVLYLARLDPNGGFALYSVPIEGGASPVRLSAPLPSGAFIEDLFLSARGDEVAYLTDEGSGRRNLYLVPSDGSTDAIRVNRLGPGPLAGDVADFGVRGEWAVYRADALEDGVTELFAAPLDGAREPVRVNRALAAGGDVQEWVFTPHGARVVYRADQSADGRSELFLRGLNSRIPARRIHPALAASRSVESFALDPLGSAAIYRADQDQNDVVELYRAPLDGSGVSARLNAPLVSGGDVQAFTLDPLGVRVVYLADQTTDGIFELFSRPLDRSTGAVRLNPDLVGGGDVLDGDGLDHAVDPLGRRAVYRADQSSNDVIELYSVPLDGSGLAIRISSALVAGGDVLDHAIDPVGVHVVYRADQQRDEVRELFAVPLDGSSAPIKLNPPLPLAGDVADQGYAIDPSGERACLVVDLAGDGSFVLFSAPLDGSSAPLRLDPPAAGRFLGPFAFRIDPSGALAFFLIRPDGATTAELWRAPLDGSTPAARVTPPGVGVNGLPEFAGGAFFYGTREAVFRVPLAGGTPQRVTPLAPLGSVWDFRATSDFVVYRADHAVAAVLDLWSSPLGPLVGRR